MGVPVLTVSHVDTVKVLAPVDETRIGAVRVGDKVHVRVYTFDRRLFEGDVTDVQPAGDFATRKDWGAQRRDIRTFTVTARVPNPDHLLKDGMTAEVTIGNQSLPMTVEDETTFHFRRRGFVGINECPALRLVGATRVPYADRARGRPQHREIGEHRTRYRLAQACSRSEALRQFQLDPRLVGQHVGIRHVGDHIWAGRHRAVPIAGRHRPPCLVGLDAEISAGPGLHR